jgi:tRNA dimethylallyltransferase
LSPRPRLAILTGPTGAGKSELALAAALALGGEIINADSLALYRGFDLGTAKPSPADRARAPHHLLDILDPDQAFDAAAYLKAARPLIRRLARAGRPALVVGGTGFYLRALTRGLFNGPGRDEAFRARLAAEDTGALHTRLAAVDPLTAARVGPADRVRLERALEVHHLTGRPISQWQKEHGLRDKPFETLTLVLDRPPAELEARLRRRTDLMFAEGLKDEVEKLLQAGWAATLKPFGAIGYRETLDHIRGLISLDRAREKTFLATRRYAKRQRTWFRGQMPEARWFHPDQNAAVVELLRDFFRPRPADHGI